MNRTACNFITLSALLAAAQVSLAQGQPDPCADSYFAWQYTQCASPQAIEGRRARGIAEPAQPEDPMVVRARRSESASARSAERARQLRQAQDDRAASGVAPRE